MFKFTSKTYILFGISLLIIGSGVYFAFFHDFGDDLDKIKDSTAKSVVGVSGDAIISYDSQTHTLERDANGQNESLATFDSNPSKLQLTQDATKAIVYQNAQDVNGGYVIYDLTTHKEYPQEQWVRDISISSSGKLGYFYKNIPAKQSKIVVSGIDGSNTQTVLQIPYDDAQLFKVKWVGDYLTVLDYSGEDSVSMRIINTASKNVVQTLSLSFYSVYDVLPSGYAWAITKPKNPATDIDSYTFGTTIILDLKTGKVVKEMNDYLSHGRFLLPDKTRGVVFSIGYLSNKLGLYEINTKDYSIKLLQSLDTAAAIKNIYFSPDESQIIIDGPSLIRVKI